MAITVGIESFSCSVDIKLPELDPDTWSRDIVYDQLFNEADRAKIVMIMWAIWTSRTNITHGKGGLDPTQCMKRTKKALAVLEIPKEHAQVLPGHGWRPLDNEWVKVNTNPCISVDDLKAGAILILVLLIP
jgi:hypothetical protein